MLVSSNEHSSPKSFCSLVGECGLCGKNRAFFPEEDLDTAEAPKPSHEGVCVCVCACVCVECVMDVWSEAYPQHVWDLCHVCLHSMSLWGGYYMLSFGYVCCVCVMWKRVVC